MAMIQHNGVTYTLAFNFNSLCAVESDTGRSYPQIAKELTSGDVRMTTVLSLFRACLLKSRPQITAEEAGEIIDEIGPQKAAELIGVAIAESPMFASAAKPAKIKKAA
jgi:hypothetical protein